jgi:hypothetical protein
MADWRKHMKCEEENKQEDKKIVCLRTLITWQVHILAWCLRNTCLFLYKFTFDKYKMAAPSCPSVDELFFWWIPLVRLLKINKMVKDDENLFSSPPSLSVAARPSPEPSPLLCAMAVKSPSRDAWRAQTQPTQKHVPAFWFLNNIF